MPRNAASLSVEWGASAMGLDLCRNKRAALWPPLCSACGERLLHAEAAATGTPDVNADEQEQPHHVDEMPVPGGELEAEMLLGREMPGERASQAYDQEYGPDDD